LQNKSDSSEEMDNDEEDMESVRMPIARRRILVLGKRKVGVTRRDRTPARSMAVKVDQLILRLRRSVLVERRIQSPNPGVLGSVVGLSFLCCSSLEVHRI
jgi:hypothetical protein